MIKKSLVETIFNTNFVNDFNRVSNTFLVLHNTICDHSLNTVCYTYYKLYLYLYIIYFMF